MLSTTIRSKIDSLWDKFWSGGIANPLTAIEQISYLLFMRRLDETDQHAEDNAQFIGRDHHSFFKGTFKTPSGKEIPKKELRWSFFKRLPAEEMLPHVRDAVFPFIKSLKNEEEPFARHMQDAVFIIPKPSLLVEAVGIIDEIYKEIEREQREQGQSFQDTQGDIYEHLLSEIAQAGKNGQFRTPRHIIQMICSLVDPKLGNIVCDPSCGTGGFLLGAYQHILTQHTSPHLRQNNEAGIQRGLIGDKLTDPRQWQVLKEKTFCGYDFDTTMIRIGLMNLLLHGIDQPNLEYQDTLSKRFKKKECFDIVLANPPFKGSIDKGDISEELSLKTTKTELLFVNLIMNLLTIGGKAGVIVPDGVLFGSSNAHQDLRKMLLEHCDLQAVISMPSGVFRPYAGVSTAVLIFIKGATTERVWFYDMESDGFSLDDKRNPIKENDIPDIVEKWNCRQHLKAPAKGEKWFWVEKQQIVDNKYDLSINRYKTIEHEEVSYDPPKAILKKLIEMEREIQKDLEELGGMLG